VTPSTYIHGSYDYIGNGIIWDPGNSDHALPNSLYLTGKPAWFGDRPWPPFDPSSISATAVAPTNLPAGYRYVFGASPPPDPRNLPLEAVISVFTNVIVTNVVMEFNGSFSRNPKGVMLTYRWLFGDGAAATDGVALHTFSTPGTYNVQLSVSDGVNTSATNTTIQVGTMPSNPLELRIIAP
jgi:hypothetical protein